MMKNPITKKVQELLNDGADIEQSRSTGIIIRSKVNFIDAAYDGIGADTKEREGNKDVDSSIVQARRDSPLNEIP